SFMPARLFGFLGTPSTKSSKKSFTSIGFFLFRCFEGLKERISSKYTVSSKSSISFPPNSSPDDVLNIWRSLNNLFLLFGVFTHDELSLCTSFQHHSECRMMSLQVAHSRYDASSAGARSTCLTLGDEYTGHVECVL